MLEQALWYWRRGFIVLPLVYNTKEPPKGFPLAEVRWTMPTEEQIREWFPKGQKWNIAIQPTDWQVPDFDRKDWLELVKEYSLPDTFSYHTTKGGHVWLRGWNGIKIPKVEIMGKDWSHHYIVAPPSVVDGVKRSWKHPDRLQDLSNTNLPIVARRDSCKSIYIDSMEGGCGGKPVWAIHPMFGNGTRDEDLFHTAHCLIKSGMAEGNASQVLERVIKTWDERQPEHQNKKWVEDKISSVLKRAERVERNISEEVREYVRETNGPFRATDMYKNLLIETKGDKKSAMKELQRSTTRGELVPTGRINGEYRRLDRQLVKLDWEKADPSKPLGLVLPFQIHEMVNLFHKNLIVVAGAPDAGKSAFMLNVIAQNMRKWKIRFFTSEMSEQELRLRLSAFEDIEHKDWKFDAYERGRDYAPVIDPNGLNIIDYMEVHENFHLVAQWLDEIFQKLKHGVAFVALQKKRSTKDQQYDLGRGAEFSLERPRLYIAMDSGRLKIIKAKNWVKRDVNPNGREYRFKLVGGCKFIEQGDSPHEVAEILKDERGNPYIGRS